MSSKLSVIANEKFSNTCMIVLAAYPILSYYLLINEFSYADILSCILLTIGIFKYGMLNRYHFHFPTLFSLYWFYIALVTIFTAPVFKITNLIPGGITFFVWIIQVALYACFFDLDKYIKYLNWIFWFVAILFFIQYLLRLSGVNMPMFLPLGNSTSYCGMSYNEVIDFQLGFNSRSSSIFPEPAYLGQFCSVVLSINLFYKENAQKLITPIVGISIVVLLLSGSGSGIFIALLLLILKFFNIVFFTGKTKLLLIIFALAPIVYYVVTYYLTSQIGLYVLSRTNELESDSSSGYIRLVSGYFYFEEQDLSHMLLGADRLYVSRLFDGDKRTFINGIASYLLYNGIIGSVLVLLTLIISSIKKEFIVFAVVIMFLGLSAIEATYMREFSMAVFALVIGYEYKRK